MKCPNCGVPCVKCAGVKIVTASDGKTVCTKCIAAYEMSKGRNPNQPVNPSHNNFQESPPPTLNNNSIAPKVVSITFNNLNDN